MITVDLIRTIYGKWQTLGFMQLGTEKLCSTLELPWKENKRGISCIPEGVYTMVKRAGHEKRPYEHFHVTNVPGRSLILVHPGTFVTHTKGCILPGLDYAFVNADNLFDTVNSKLALQHLLDKLPAKCLLNIKRG